MLLVAHGQYILDSLHRPRYQDPLQRHGTGPNILSSVLKAIIDGETLHLKKRIIHRPLLHYTTLVSSALLQLEEWDITNGQ